MISNTKASAGAAAFLLLLASPLAAQEMEWSERMYIAIDVPFQPLDNDFSETLSFADSVRPNENVNFVMRYPEARGAVFDAGAGFRVRGRLGGGIVASWAEGSSTGSFALTLPNPVAANNPLALDATTPSLSRAELGIHFQALYMYPISRTVRVVLSAGPSVFRTRQDLVRSVDVDILPGFRSVQFDKAAIIEEQQTSIGFNAGVDLSWRFARRLGVATLARYSRANVTWKPPSTSGVSRTIEARAGGLHLGGGVRLLF